jgi:benzodiazapine receptor
MMRMDTVFRAIPGILLWLGVTFIAAAVGAAATVDAGAFYGQLAQPSWAPPSWLFGPVWTVLYLAMGIAAWLVWRTPGPGRARGALVLFLAQLIVNGLWSWLFFGWHLGAWAFADIVLLWLLIVATGIAFWRVRRAGAWLLLPYLLWVSFALVLNYSMWQLNPEILG